MKNGAELPRLISITDLTEMSLKAFDLVAERTAGLAYISKADAQSGPHDRKFGWCHRVETDWSIDIGDLVD